LLFGSLVFISTLLFWGNGYLFYLFFVVRNNAVCSIPFKCKVVAFNMDHSAVFFRKRGGDRGVVIVQSSDLTREMVSHKQVWTSW